MSALPLGVRALARNAACAPDAEVRKTTGLRILDLLGCACAGFRIGTWRALDCALGAEGASRVWFRGARRSTADAMRLNTFMSHAAYMEDGSRSTGGHPSCVVIPTALTVLGSLRDRPAAPVDLVSAVAFGYDTFLRIGERVYPAIVDRGFQSTAVLAPIASAATTSRLLGLGEDRIAQALAIAATLGAGLKAALRASASQPLQVAQGCEAGRIAALMAADGARGHEDILADGFFPAYAGGERAASEPKRPRMLETYVKIHGGCRGNHAPLDAFLALFRQHSLSIRDLRSVVVHVDRYTLAAEIEHPVKSEQAQFSIAFAIAVAAVHGETSAFAFSARHLADPLVIGVMSRIVVEHDAAFDAEYPTRRAARVTIETNAQKLAFVIEYPVGEPENPVTEAALCAKFEELARPVLADDTDRVRDFVLDLERQRSLSPLLDALGRCRSTEAEEIFN
ncbi:MAG: MmgE/PrpD family protein [Pseudorhodoplanes sp.]|nr:MmgE/PrpD family protein [Pseudorhodoplanes sp.]